MMPALALRAPAPGSGPDDTDRAPGLRQFAAAFVARDSRTDDGYSISFCRPSKAGRGAGSAADKAEAVTDHSVRPRVRSQV
jgi:hypothetical protein